jgi:glycosyltransferase involved in cell wall biosynthesis
MSPRVALITEIIAPYRIPVFNALSRNEHLDLHVVFLAETDSALRQWRVYKSEISFSYEVLPSWRLRAGKRNLLLNWRVRSRLGLFNPEAIICGGYNYLASWQALRWANHHQVDFILWSESNAQDARKSKSSVEMLKMSFLNRCDRFIVPGKSSFAYLQQLGANPGSIFVAPNAVDNSLFQSEVAAARTQESAFRHEKKLPQKYLLYVGRLVPEKGIFDLLAAYAQLEPDVRSTIGLVFAGDGHSRSELEFAAKKVQPGTVCFPGFVHREDLAGFYAFAETLVLPTHSDPWGLVVNEAMACELPIIVTSVAGCAADLVQDGGNGFIVPPRDPGTLSRAMLTLVRDPQLRKQMSARSVEKIRSFSPESCAAGLAEAALSSSAPYTRKGTS